MLADFPRSVVEAARPHDHHERKAQKLCTAYKGCEEPPLDDSNECAKHDARSKRRKRRWWRKRAAALKKQRNALKRQRKMWAKRKRCLACGDKRVKGQEHCAKHQIRFGDLDRSALDKSLDNKGARIASNTSIDADGRSRYRGQGKRGQPKRGAIDAKDLGYALDALGRGAKGLAFVDALATEPLTKAQRHEAKTEALAQLDQAQRFIDDVLERHGYFGKVDPDDKPNRR